ncbi:MAG: WecB/TagA/CpsF family glycosyltransferase [Patescibacteria group bacterium]
MLKIFGLPISDISYSETINQIKTWLKQPGQYLIVTVNPEILLQAKKDLSYRNILQKSSLCVPDGFGIILLSYLIGKALTKGRVRGVDLADHLMSNALSSGHNVFLIGNSETVLTKVASKYEGGINYTVGPMFTSKASFPLNDPVNNELINKIKAAKPDILLVAFGAPKQEYWLNYYLSQLPSVKVGIGVGGSFDYLGKKVGRAPSFFQKLGLEWFWRVLRQPWRLIRIIRAVIIFPILAIFDHFKH